MPGALGVQTRFHGQPLQSFVRADVLAIGEIGAQQNLLQRQLATFEFGPVQQSMRIKGVVDATAPVHVESETHCRTTLADGRAVGIDLIGTAAVLARQVLGGIFTLGGHLRVQFKRLEVDLGADLPVELRQCLLQRRQSHRTPRAGNVGDKVDADGSGSGHVGPAKRESDSNHIGVLRRGSMKIGWCAQRVMLSATASATLMPSTAAERMPPA